MTLTQEFKNQASAVEWKAQQREIRNDIFDALETQEASLEQLEQTDLSEFFRNDAVSKLVEAEIRIFKNLKELVRPEVEAAIRASHQSVGGGDAAVVKDSDQRCVDEAEKFYARTLKLYDVSAQKYLEEVKSFIHQPSDNKAYSTLMVYSIAVKMADSDEAFRQAGRLQQATRGGNILQAIEKINAPSALTVICRKLTSPFR